MIDRPSQHEIDMCIADGNTIMVLDKNFCRGHANFFRDEAEMREIYQEIHGTSEGVVFEFIGIGG